mgnify:CR=1 FL=1
MKKLVSVSLAAAMVASMTACGSNNTAETTAAAAAGETSAAADGASFKIGLTGPLTGAAAAYGNAVVNGAKLAADEINAAGGANGYTFEVNGQDDENDTEKAINAYNTLKDWGMQILVGTTTSKPCIAVAAETANDNMFQITPSGSAVECVANDNVFRVCFADPDQGTSLRCLPPMMP